MAVFTVGGALHLISRHVERGGGEVETKLF